MGGVYDTQLFSWLGKRSHGTVAARRRRDSATRLSDSQTPFVRACVFSSTGLRRTRRGATCRSGDVSASRVPITSVAFAPARTRPRTPEAPSSSRVLPSFSLSRFGIAGADNVGGVRPARTTAHTRGAVFVSRPSRHSRAPRAPARRRAARALGRTAGAPIVKAGGAPSAARLAPARPRRPPPVRPRRRRAHAGPRVVRVCCAGGGGAQAHPALRVRGARLHVRVGVAEFDLREEATTVTNARAGGARVRAGRRGARPVPARRRLHEARQRVRTAPRSCPARGTRSRRRASPCCRRPPRRSSSRGDGDQAAGEHRAGGSVQVQRELHFNMGAMENKGLNIFNTASRVTLARQARRRPPTPTTSACRASSRTSTSTTGRPTASRAATGSRRTRAEGIRAHRLPRPDYAAIRRARHAPRPR